MWADVVAEKLKDVCIVFMGACTFICEICGGTGWGGDLIKNLITF